MSLEEAPKLRLFTAIELPADTKSQLGGLLHRLKTGVQFTGAHPTWVTADYLHLTLVFLGSQPQERVGVVEQAMQSAAWTIDPFALRLSGLELFPSPREPRVISIAVKGATEALTQVHSTLSHELGLQGFEVEIRPYRAHLTLARIKSVKGLAGLRDVVKSHADFSAGEFEAKAITLFRSTLTPAGAVYQPLWETAFGRTERDPDIPAL